MEYESHGNRFRINSFKLIIDSRFPVVRIDLALANTHGVKLTFEVALARLLERRRRQ